MQQPGRIDGIQGGFLDVSLVMQDTLDQPLMQMCFVRSLMFFEKHFLTVFASIMSIYILCF